MRGNGTELGHWRIVPPLIAALSSLDVFEAMGALGIARGAITFHVVGLSLETITALYLDSIR